MLRLLFTLLALCCGCLTYTAPVTDSSPGSTERTIVNPSLLCEGTKSDQRGPLDHLICLKIAGLLSGIDTTVEGLSVRIFHNNDAIGDYSNTATWTHTELINDGIKIMDINILVVNNSDGNIIVTINLVDTESHTTTDTSEDASTNAYASDSETTVRVNISALRTNGNDDPTEESHIFIILFLVLIAVWILSNLVASRAIRRPGIPFIYP